LEKGGQIQKTESVVAWFYRILRNAKLRKRPIISPNETFDAILTSLPGPYRTMVVVVQCLGLRVSEITGLQWGDLDVERRQLAWHD
jgi:integrase